MNKGFEVRIYPTKEQQILINKTFGCAILQLLRKPRKVAVSI